MNRYRCDTCGCYLDPGEGRTCDECQNWEQEHVKKIRKMRAVVREVGQQYEFDFGGQTYEFIRN